MNFKKGDTVMWCGAYGDVMVADNDTCVVEFAVGTTLRTFDQGGKFYTLDFVDFPHFPKLEHAQRPDAYPRTIQVRQSVRGMLRLNDKDIFDEFINNFDVAKESIEKGDYETVKKFFSIYC